MAVPLGKYSSVKPSLRTTSPVSRPTARVLPSGTMKALSRHPRTPPSTPAASTVTIPMWLRKVPALPKRLRSANSVRASPSSPVMTRKRRAASTFAACTCTCSGETPG